MKKTIVTVLLFLVLWCSGCQPTPDKEIVVGKNDFAAKIVSSDEALAIYEATEIWQEEFQSNDEKLSVIIDAPVTVPNVNAFPVVKIRPMVITQEQADIVIKVLLGGATLYEKSVKTKREITDEILRIRQYIADPNTDFNISKDANPEYYAEVLADFDAQIRRLEIEYETAPDSYTPKEASNLFVSEKDNLLAESVITWEQYEQITDFGVIEGEADLGNGKSVYLNIMTDEYFLNNRIIFFNTQYELSASETILLNDAVCIAKDIITQIGLGDMEVAASHTSASNNSFVLYFTRNVMGIPTNYASETDFSNNEPIYSPPWYEETLEVEVDNTGLCSLYLSNPIEVTEIINANAALLPFEKIQEIFREQIQYKNLWFDNPDVV